MVAPKPRFVSQISWRHIATYYRGTRSLLRQYQDDFVRQHGAACEGTVIEIGGTRANDYRRFFPNAARYVCTNIAGDCDQRLDATDMHELATDSVDNFLCVSVLEHIPDLPKAMSEIRRALRPGGRLILTVPFSYSRHGDGDYWRLGSDAYPHLLPGFEVDDFAQLGGLFAVAVDGFQRPKGQLTPRTLVRKTIGVGLAVAGKFLDGPDGFAAGFGISARKVARS